LLDLRGANNGGGGRRLGAGEGGAGERARVPHRCMGPQRRLARLPLLERRRSTVTMERRRSTGGIAGGDENSAKSWPWPG